jgi:hypothetical protein
MKNLTGILTLTILLASLSSYSQGDLLITPKRVVFENNKQKEEISLVNIGKDTATYSISFIEYDMKEDGSFVIIDKPDSARMMASPYLRIFPRKVTLAPREPQVISLQCRRMANMPVGEFRSHLYFRSEKNYSALGLPNKNADSTKLRVALIPVFGLSIPIIVRSGDVSAGASLSDIQLSSPAAKDQTLNVTINRSGNGSLYGDIVVLYNTAQGKSIEVGRMNGVGIYSTINKRHVSLKLKDIEGNKLIAGSLKVQYLNKTENSSLLYAEKDYSISLLSQVSN